MVNQLQSTQMENSPLIQVRQLCKSYENHNTPIQILENAAFNLAPGETVAIVGASGIGKSTFLHILGTLDRPDSGTVLYKGQNVFSLKDVALAKFRNAEIGFVFQFHYLLGEFSALENTMIPALISGVSKSAARDKASEMLDKVGLGHRLTHRPSELSGGEKQRVAVARALVLAPSVLMADEPTGNLDNETSGRIHELLVSLNEELKMAMVIVTHNFELATLMSRQVTIDGKQIMEKAVPLNFNQN